MTFTNRILSDNDLSASHIDMTALSPKYLPLELKIYTVLTMVIIFILVFLSFEWLFALPVGYFKALPWLISGVFIIGAIVFTYICLAFPKKQYAVREHDLHYVCGLIFQTHICQPILRIQHIEIKRGPFERKAGLATLLVYSAGGMQHTFFIPGLEHETAIKLRAFILENRDLMHDETDESDDFAT